MLKLITFLKFIPALIAAIMAIEDAIPIGGKGREKLDLVLGVSKDIYESSAELQKEFGWDTLSTFIIKAAGRLVALFNTVGIFKSKSTQTAAAAVG